MAFRNGTYSGFAQKGGTDREHLAIAVEQAERKNPNSHLWEGYARSAMQSLADILGTEAYKAWAEKVWPGPAIDDYTWFQICNQSDASLALAQNGERNLDILAACARMTINLGVSDLGSQSQNTRENDACHNLGAGNDH